MNKKFTKWMAAALLLLLITPPMWVWGQTSVDVTLSSGSFNNNVITWTCADGNITIQQLKGSSSTNPNSSYISAPRVYKQNILSFVGNNGYTITSIDIKYDGSYYGSTKYAGTEISDNNVGNNTTALTPTWSTAAAGTHHIATVNSDGLSEIYIQNGHSSDGSGQLRITKITITYKVSGSITATTVTINAGGLTNTDVYASTTAGSLSASVTETESGNAISNATVTWTSSNTDVATIDNSGAVTLVAAGATTITASYAGESGVYGLSSDTYELTVTSSEPYVQPTTIEIIPNYTFWGMTGLFSGSTYDELTGSQENVSLRWTRGSGSTYANMSAMRFYKDNTLVFTAPEGYEIISIELTVSGTYNDLTFSPTGFVDETTTWTGSSETVTMSRPSNGSSYATISKFTITLAAQGSAVATTTTINVPQNFNTDIYQGTSAGTLTATVTENVNNTTISGATVTWESSNTSIATINANGVVTLVAVGTTTITASYAGVEDQYRPSSATYELTVINSAPSISFNGSSANIGTYPTGEEITLDGIIVSQNSLTENISLIATKGTVTPQTINVGAEPTEIVWKYTPTEAGYTTETITATSGDVEATYEIQFVAKTPHDITIASGITHGTITSNKATAIENENVDLTVTPASGYELDELTIMAGETPIVPVPIEDKPTYRFRMPNSNVTVSATFKEVADYATLPFNWAGGTKEDLVALTGVSGYGLGTNYGTDNAPYRVKFDTNGDYIQVKTDSQPDKVTIGVKMIGGATTSKITVKVSTDGTTFDDGEELTISGSQNDFVNLETTRTFGSDVRYVRMVFTKGSNVGVGPISITKYVPKYAVNLNQPQQGQGTIAADKTEAAEGETVTLTATPNTGYAFESWTVLDGEANEVTVTNDQFTMPASAVEVEANFNELQKHNIVIADAIEENVIVDAEENKAYAGETVTISVEAPTGKVLATLTVTGNISSNIMTIDPAVSPYVDDYTFTMPDEDVTINATFDNAPSFIVTFSVNGSVDDNLEVSVTQGQSTALPTSSTLTPSGFSITGWAASEGSLVAVANPYAPTDDITLYAILGQTIPHSLVINASTPNFPTSYGTANTFTEYNLGGKNFMIQQGYINGGKLQWRASGNSNGTGTMYNSKDLGKINTIILVYDSSDNNKNFTIKAGTTENPTGGTTINPTTNGLVYTFDLSEENYSYFVMTNGDGAGYLQSISIDFVADLNINTVVEYATTTSLDENIATNECVIVKNGAVLTFTGENQGTADNLIIEDGGQLIVNTSGVQATVKKAIAAPAKAADHWYTISSPINNIAIGNVTNLVLAEPAVYDLYRYDEPTHMWENYKNEAHADFTNLTNGRGYLYYNSTGDDLAFAGELNASDVEISLTADGDKLTGFNLIGNPYSHDIYKGAGTAIENSGANGYVLAEGFYTLTDQSAWKAGTDYSTAIKPSQGFLVQATTAGTLTITNTNAQGSAKANNEMIQFTVTNGQYEDVTYALFDEAIGLNKIEHLNPEVPMLYIAQNGQDYAIATMERNTTAFDLNLSVATAGEYTICAKALGSYDYLHLFDRMTGIDIDLLAADKYTFNSNPRDYMYRFEVRLSENATTDSETNFAFFNGNTLNIINEGEATLQVIDMTGRVLRCEAINGSASIGTQGLATGVYMLRLVNGNNIKTQKMVMK